MRFPVALLYHYKSSESNVCDYCANSGFALEFYGNPVQLKCNDDSLSLLIEMVFKSNNQ